MSDDAPLPLTDTLARLPSLDMARAAARDRLRRLRDSLAHHDIGGAVLFNSINLRYACDSRSMQINTGRNPGRYVFVENLLSTDAVMLVDHDDVFHSGRHPLLPFSEVHIVSPAVEVALVGQRRRDHLSRMSLDANLTGQHNDHRANEGLAAGPRSDDGNSTPGGIHIAGVSAGAVSLG